MPLTYFQIAIPACYFGGGIFGATLGAWAAEALGRRRALFLASVMGIVGGALIGSAVNISMILLGRLMSGLW